MANGVVSTGITLSYKNGTGEFVELTNLQEIPELGGEVEAIEITTLADTAHMYTDGLKNYGDSLAFIFLYETAQFETLNGLTGVSEWQVALPDGTTCSFSGSSSVKLAGAGIATALTYTLAIKPNSEMIWG
jgi:hypothetical protein